MMNRILLNGLVKRLEKTGLKVFIPRMVPPNDGGISLGQVFAVGGNL
jgi:hydrogenase maturation protein HypF